MIVDFTYTAEMFKDALNTPQLASAGDPHARCLAALHLIDEKIRSGGGWYEYHHDRFITVGSPNIGAGEVGHLQRACRVVPADHGAFQITRSRPRDRGKPL